MNRIKKLIGTFIIIFGTQWPWMVSAANDVTIKKLDPAAIASMLERPAAEGWVSGEVIVKYKADQRMSTADATAMGFADKTATTSGGEVIYRFDQATISAMSVEDAKARTKTMVEDLMQRDDVEYAQPNYYFRIKRTPNDQFFPLQWHYFDNGNGGDQSPGGVNLPTVWDGNVGNRNVVVAVIDTGILGNHPDIANSSNLVPGFDMISNTVMANDGDGRDSDPTDPGDAFADDECGQGIPARPDSWHGSHVAGTVGVVNSNNSVGVAGTNWDVSVQAVRVLGKCGGTTSDINDAIRWAAGLPVPGVPSNSTPARVINMSLGGGGACSQSPATQNAINDAVAAGVTVVVAAGNEAQNAANTTPAGCDNVVTVAASDYRGHLVSRYSNFGAAIDIMAPGGDVQRDDNNDDNPDGVLSTVEGGYAFYNGTSMASPHVAGVAALLLATEAGLTPQQVTQRIMDNAIPRTSAQCPQPCGAGLLNANFDAEQPQINLSPDPATMEVGQTGTINARVTQGGTALANATVEFVSSDTGVVSVAPAMVVTNNSGMAQATITGVAQGNASIQATTRNMSDSIAIDVNPAAAPNLTWWGMVLMIIAMLILVYRRTSYAPR